MNRQRLHEIVESVKEDYLLNTIEETTGEVEVLRTKKFLNETSASIERMLKLEEAELNAKTGAILGAIGAGTLGAGIGSFAGHLTGLGMGADMMNNYQDIDPNMVNGQIVPTDPSYMTTGLGAYAGGAIGTGVGALAGGALGAGVGAAGGALYGAYRNKK